jgi:glycosyltransferase involved in cell wall biosynthesis
MSMRPLFTVIIAVYNGAATIGRAIESVLAQSYTHHELIVVDDGSTDATPQLVRQFGDTVRYLRQENAGVSAARNAGARHARGEWLAFLDADDWYYPDRLRWHAEWIMRDANLDFLTGDYDYVRPDGGHISRSMEKHASGRVLLQKAAGAPEVIMTESEFESFVADHFGDTHTLSVRREMFLRLGGYPLGFRVCEDVLFLTRLCAASRRVGVICRPLAAYLIHDNSATRRDRLRSQTENVRTLVTMAAESRSYPATIRRGVLARLREGRLDLGYALLRVGRKAAAVGAVTPTLWESPGVAGLRDMISMVRG